MHRHFYLQKVFYILFREKEKYEESDTDYTALILKGSGMSGSGADRQIIKAGVVLYMSSGDTVP